MKIIFLYILIKKGLFYEGVGSSKIFSKQYLTCAIIIYFMYGVILHILQFNGNTLSPCSTDETKAKMCAHVPLT